MKTKKCIIAIDFGTTNMAWSIRMNDTNSIPTCISPITNQITPQKTPSDIHFFLNDPNEQLSTINSQLGTKILSKFKQNTYKQHYHFAFYKMMMYDYKPGTTDFLYQTHYPTLPLVQPINDKNCTRKFQLSEIFNVVVHHVKESILQYFTNSRTSLKTNEIMWFLTVPAIAGQAQKIFMRSVFKDAMGSFNGQQLTDDSIDCIEEPYGGFLYAMELYKNQFQQSDQIVAILDIGGGTYDITVAKFSASQGKPEIILSDFGSVAGGSEVDKLFMSEVMGLLQLEKFNVHEYKMSIIYSNMLNQFQQEKHYHLSKLDLSDEVFQISLSEIRQLKEGQQIIDNLKKNIDKLNINKTEDELDIQVEVEKDELQFLADYAVSKYLQPTQKNLMNTTTMLMQKVNKLKDQNGKMLKVSQAILLGGFSSCQSLAKHIKSEITSVIVFPQPSIAIVNGATYFAVAETITKISKALGLEAVVGTDSIDQSYLDSTKYPQFEQYIDRHNKKTGLGIICLFDKDTEIKTGMQCTRKFKPFNPQQNEESVVDFVVHEFQPTGKCPQIYAYDQNIINKKHNPLETQNHYEFQVQIPSSVPIDQRYIEVTFKYTDGGTMLVYYTIGSSERQEIVIKPKQQIRFLSTRYQTKPVHTIFCVDKSGSMNGSTMWKNYPHDLLIEEARETLLADVFLGGICVYLETRQRIRGGLTQDLYSIVLFDEVSSIKCEKETFNQPNDCLKYAAEPDDCTSFEPALLDALKVAMNDSSNHDLHLVFLSDGENQDEVSQDVIDNVKSVFKDNIYFIAFGSEGIEYLGKFSALFGKTIMEAKDSAQLPAIFAKISLPELM